MVGSVPNPKTPPSRTKSINNRLLTPLKPGEHALLPENWSASKSPTQKPLCGEVDLGIQQMRDQLRQLSAGEKTAGSEKDRKNQPRGSIITPKFRPATADGLQERAKASRVKSGIQDGQSLAKSLTQSKLSDYSRPMSVDIAAEQASAPGLQRNEERIRGWRRLWDKDEKAWYWIDTNSHTAQWNHPLHKYEKKVEIWDGKAQPVTDRAERTGVAMGLAGQEWFPQHSKVTIEDTENKTVTNRRAILMMLQKWAEKWDTMVHAFREMDVNHDGDLSRAELATALIRFNIMHTDDLVDEAWNMLDVDGSGSVSVNEFKEFVDKHSVKQVQVHGSVSRQLYRIWSYGYVASTDQLRGAASEVLRKKKGGLDAEALSRMKMQSDANGRRLFTRRVIDKVGRLLASFAGGKRLGRAAFAELLGNNQLMPRNEIYAAQLFAFLDAEQTGLIAANDLTVDKLRAFAATPMPGPAEGGERSVVWNPVDGGSQPEQMQLLPLQHRKHIQNFRDVLATRCQGTKDTFRYLDWDKDGVIHKHEFVKVLADLGLVMPQETLDYLWQILDTNMDGKIKFGEYIDLFENIRSQPRRLPPTAAVRPPTNPVSGLRIPNYLATRATMSGRVLNVVMMAPSDKGRPLRVPMMNAPRDLHKRQEFLGIYPRSGALREAVLSLGKRPDHGAKDIFRHV